MPRMINDQPVTVADTNVFAAVRQLCLFKKRPADWNACLGFMLDLHKAPHGDVDEWFAQRCATIGIRCDDARNSQGVLEWHCFYLLDENTYTGFDVRRALVKRQWKDSSVDGLLRTMDRNKVLR